MRRATSLTIALTLGLLAGTWPGVAPAQNRVSQLDPRTLQGAQPVSPAPTEAFPAAAIPRTVTLEAGTGMLLRLPAPAATVLSAEPAIARVQPASPTTLFLMGVAQGRTTVIAMSDNGTPIGQYDIVVTPGLGRGLAAAPAAAAIGVPRTIGLGPEAAREVQLAIHRSVPGSRTVTSAVRGLFRDSVATRNEAMQFVRGR